MIEFIILYIALVIACILLFSSGKEIEKEYKVKVTRRGIFTVIEKDDEV